MAMTIRSPAAAIHSKDMAASATTTGVAGVAMRSLGSGRISCRKMTPKKNSTAITTSCSSSSDSAPQSSDSSSTERKSCTPKLEPFSMSKMDLLLKNPPLIERTRNELADYCSRLEGEECYSCWDAYMELRYLENECPKQEVENLIIGAEGLKALVQWLHRRTALIKAIKQEQAAKAIQKGEGDHAHQHQHVPDASSEEGKEGGALLDIEEDSGGIMDDSPYTRMLRVIARGGYPTHYNPT